MIPFELSTEESALVRGGFFRRSRENKGKTNMKQLKFMLAAATAVGIAAAAQADTSKLIDNENFENQDVGTLGRALTGWSYSDSANAEQDDDSKVELDGSNKALKVNTGTKPLLRHLNEEAGNAVDMTEDGFESLYIDTMVQFTVTPDGDPVTEGDEDKLMIYLREVPAEGDTPASTKLMVKSRTFTPANGRNPAVFGVKDDYELKGITVVPGEWYHLVVEASLNDAQFTQFRIKMAKGNEDLVLLTNEAGLIATDNTLFPSLQGAYSEENAPKACSLEYVGFAGEGMVDDLTVATVTVATSVDFTFTWTTAGISSVTYTIGDAAAVSVTSGVKIENLAANTVLKLTVTPAEWYKLADNAVLEYTATKVGDFANLNDLVSEVTSSDIVVNNPTGADATTVNAALAWAKSAGMTTAAVEGAANIVANYLLNVADLAVEPKIKITSIDLSGDVPTVTAEVTAADGTTTIKTLTADNINSAASIKYKAAATLEALKNAASKSAIEAGDKFIQVVVE